MTRLIAVLAMLLCALALGACGSDDDEDAGTGEVPADATPAETAEQQPAGGCPEVEAPEPKETSARAPRGALDDSKTWRVVVTTNCGEFTIELDLEAAPKTAASFVSLARSGFYDDTTFHRIAPGFVIQGGDPLGDGTGGPGYQTEDPPPPDTTYTRGVVAMAKTAEEPPGTAGSQFFLVTGDDVGLPPDYAVLGKVVDGAQVVDTIGALGSATEQPTQVVVIEGMKVEES